jgi:hypothetical protein
MKTISLRRNPDPGRLGQAAVRHRGDRHFRFSFVLLGARARRVRVEIFAPNFQRRVSEAFWPVNLLYEGRY